MVNITIDGVKVEVPEGTTVLGAAREAGIPIPTLCDHEELKPYGGCRLCLVDVEGFRTLQTSCTLPVSNNMVVHTNTDRVQAARKFVLTLIFSERNHFCPYCQVSGGDCELQNAAYGLGMTHWPLQPNWQPYEVDASHPYMILDHNRCILCRRCVRACEELVGVSTLGFEERGARSFLVADLGVPLGESTCVGCGTCLEVCPTGAIIDRISAYRGKETQADHTESVCVGCSIGCTMDVLTRDNNILRIESTWEAELNEGLLCKQGRFVPLFRNEERLRTPLVRKEGKLVAATWDDALNTIASEFKTLSGQENGIAALASTRLSAEALALFKEIFGSNLKTKSLASLDGGIFLTSSIGLNGALPKGDMESIKSAEDYLVIDEDLTKDHEVAGFFVRRNLAAGSKLVLVDTEANQTEELASISLKGKNNTEAFVLDGLLAALKGIDPNSSTEKSGIPAESFVQAAQLLKDSSNLVAVCGKRAGTNSELMTKLVDLAKALGSKIKFVFTHGGANSLAASKLGLDQSFDLSKHKAAFVALGDDELSQKVIQDLNKVNFLVVQASHISPLTASASVVLPVANWAEQDGHYLNFTGEVQKSNHSVTHVEGILSNQESLAKLAAKLGMNIDVENWQKELSIDGLLVK